uniref:CAZy families PL1 protein n=1 Tax=uncultured Flavobacteriaceae bacterium TaxID=165436 RepID=A0A060C8I0_9FLAO|nr:CAZy families PL1 protein [uncultured Flavobacteriaceae bacterium]
MWDRALYNNDNTGGEWQNAGIQNFDGFQPVEFVYAIVCSEINLNTEELSITDIQLYPNPVTENIHIKSKEEIQKVEIYSTSGNLVFSQNMNNKSIVNVEHLTNGIYLIKITDQKGVAKTAKFIKK